jgi:hypothetical protein
VIRYVDISTGIISTIAGTGNAGDDDDGYGGFSGDGGPAASALLNCPSDVAVDSSGRQRSLTMYS